MKKLIAKLKVTDRVRAWALRLGIVLDEPIVLIIDDVVVQALNEKARLIVGFEGPPRLEWPPPPPPAPIRVPAHLVIPNPGGLQ